MQGKDTKGLGVADQTKVYKAYSELTEERFKDLNLYGCGKIGEYKVKDATGQDIYVIVFGINASSAKALRDIRNKMHVVGLEINAQQEFERGRSRRMDQQMKASRDNPAVRAAGARDVDEMVREAAAKKRAAAQKPAAAMKVAPASAESTKTKGRLQPGTRFVADEDE